MAAERIIGVDFGTSTSVIRVKRYQSGVPLSPERLAAEAVIFNNGFPMVPTLIQHMKGNAYFGCDAQTPKKGAVLFRSFKADLENPDPARRQEARELTREFLGYLAGVYKSQSEGGHLGEADDQERTIISYPVKWGSGTKNFMREAAEQAGFPKVEGMDEAQAAIHAVTLQSEEYLKRAGYLEEGRPCTLLLADMGAGTTDLVLCRYTPGSMSGAETLAVWPVGGNVLFGGREVDAILQDYARSKLPGEWADRILEKCSAEKFKAWKENTVSPGLLRNDTVESFPDLDTITELLNVHMEPWHLSRHAFEESAEDYLKKFPQLIRGCIAASGIKAGDVELVILTGGHSQWYFVKEILAGKKPEICRELLPRIAADPGRILSVSRPQETVALGLVYTPIRARLMGDLPEQPAPQRAARENERMGREKTAARESERMGREMSAAREETAGTKTETASLSELSELAAEFIAAQNYVQPGCGDFVVKNQELLRQYLGIPAGEQLYLACDSTLFGSGRYGYAFAVSGIYSRRYGNPEFISWEDFVENDFQSFAIGEFGIGIGPLTICHTKTGEPQSALRMIQELQKYLREKVSMKGHLV